MILTAQKVLESELPLNTISVEFENNTKGVKTMEQSTLDYYEPIFLEVVKRNPDKFVEIMKPYVERKNNSRWLTTEELCEAIGTSSSSWHKSEIRNHPVVVAARRTDTRPYKYQASMIDEIQKVWDGRRRR